MIFDFTQKYILENDYVLLRPLKVSDKEKLINYAINEPQLWKFNINGGNGREKFKTYFDTAIKLFKEKNHYSFILFDKRSNEYAGMTRLYEISNEFKYLDIGFTWYGKKFQGAGLSKNCKYLLLKFAFNKLQMIIVGFGANSKNERSINAMKSIGCKVEEILRQFSKDADGKIIDAIQLSILKDEWEEDVKNSFKKNLNNFLAANRFYSSVVEYNKLH